MVTFYKAVILAVDLLETRIVDERHFSTRKEADAYCLQYIYGSKDVDTRYFPIVFEM